MTIEIYVKLKISQQKKPPKRRGSHSSAGLGCTFPNSNAGAWQL